MTSSYLKVIHLLQAFTNTIDFYSCAAAANKIPTDIASCGPSAKAELDHITANSCKTSIIQ